MKIVPIRGPRRVPRLFADPHVRRWIPVAMRAGSALAATLTAVHASPCLVTLLSVWAFACTGMLLREVSKLRRPREATGR